MSSVELLIKALNFPVSVCMRCNDLVTVSPSETISSLMFMMVESNIGAVIVVERERPVGIITERDVLERAIINKNVYKTTAKEVMSQPVISTEVNCSVKEALRLMRKHNIRRLAVTENGKLVGLVTERRLLTEFASQLY